jgi:hypothetical protein
MSARWMCLPDSEEYRQACRQRVEVDVAGQYANYLELLQEKCQENSDFQFDFLDHSCKNLGHSPRTPVNISAATIAKQANISARTKTIITTQDKPETIHKEKEPSSRRSKRSKQIPEMPPRSTMIVTSAPIPCGTGFAQQNATSPLQGVPPHGRNPQQREQAPLLYLPESPSADNALPVTFFSPRNDSLSDNGGMGAYQQNPYDHDALFRLSDTLMDEQYMQLDRVITFEGANFYAPDIGLGWP